MKDGSLSKMLGLFCHFKINGIRISDFLRISEVELQIFCIFALSKITHITE